MLTRTHTLYKHAESPTVSSYQAVPCTTTQHVYGTIM
jgi:hypothetical protein